jgi:hypothetical protein
LHRPSTSVARYMLHCQAANSQSKKSDCRNILTREAKVRLGRQKSDYRETEVKLGRKMSL